MGDLAYDIPRSIRDVTALKNKLKKVKSTSGQKHPFFKALSEYYEKRIGLAEKMNELKTKVVKVSVKRAQKKAETEKVYKQTFNDSTTLVKVLEQHIEEYVARAEKMATGQWNYLMSELNENDWDITKVAPRPKPTMGREAYKAAQSKNSLFMSITDDADDGQNRGLRKNSPAKKKEFIERAMKASRESYMAWVRKMIEKIGGAVKSAKMVGSPWTGATLGIVKQDGETQTWNAKMIINRSKYNTLFNQFPTRRTDKRDTL